MKKLTAMLLISAALTTQTFATMPPPPPKLPYIPPVQGSHAAVASGAFGLILVAAFLGGYDLVRRSFCIGDPLRLGGPGFGEPMPTTGNVMIPKCMRR